MAYIRIFFYFSVLNKVYHFAWVCPKQGIYFRQVCLFNTVLTARLIWFARWNLFILQVYKSKDLNVGTACILHFLLNRECILGFFWPKQGLGFKPSGVNLYQNIVKWAIQLRTNVQGFPWIAQKSNETEHQGQRKRGVTYYRHYKKRHGKLSSKDQLEGPWWVHKYKRVSLGTGSFDGSNLELLTVDRY